MRAWLGRLTSLSLVAAISAGVSAESVPRPDALLMVDQHREAIVERVVKAWPEALTAEQASVLRGTLAGLRADRLLAISISPGLGSLLGVLRGVDRIESDKGSLAASKALGEAAADLAYTPVTPCRLFDTRVSQGGLGTPTVGVRRTYGAITPVASQGGLGGCAAASGAAVALIQIGTLTPSGHGLLQGGPQDAPSFPNALILYQPGDQYGTAVAMPLNLANGQFDLLEQFATADLYGDLLGYFKPPGDATSLDIKVAGQRVMRFEYNAISPNVIGGSPANSALAGLHGATISGGGVPLGGDPDFFNEGPNQVTGHYGSVGGGFANIAALFATVGGGGGNTASDGSATVSGGCLNTASGGGSTIGGGCLNTSSGVLPSTVGGGESNTASGSYSVMSGGSLNTAGGYASAVVGGTHNIASGVHSFIGGGTLNAATGENDSVGGGNNNSASGAGSHIGGGQSNVTTGPNAAICGGNWNAASGVASAACGGLSNSASGAYSFVGGGMSNTASGAYSFAAGSYAKTQTADATPVVHDGAFVWAGAGSFAFHSTTHNEFAARTTGGVRFVTAIDGTTGLPAWTCGVSGGAGGSWGCSSDRDLKTDLVPLDGIAALERLAALPIYTWAAKDDLRRTPHAGPTAQDFMAAFRLGDNDKMIGFADAQGVAFAAIQGLNIKLAEKDRQIAELKRAVEFLLDRVSSEGRVAEGR